MPSTSKSVVIVGAGVLGLTCAYVLRERGYTVTIVARDLPTDTDSHGFASPWAGANWCSFATTDNLAEQHRDTVTFHKWTSLLPHLPRDTLALMDFDDISPTPRGPKDIWFSNLVPEFQVVPDCEDSTGYKVRYKSFTISVPNYTRWLVSELTSSTPQTLSSTTSLLPIGPPVIFHRSTLSSLSEACRFAPSSNFFTINCTGLGSATLTDVQDTQVYPVRGQTILIQSCLFHHSTLDPSARCIMQLKTNPSESISSLYIIPRAQSGQVILGGCFQPNNTCTEVDNNLSSKILNGCIQMAPWLFINKQNGEKTYQVVKENVGFRPARKDGIRIQQTGSIIHAYGIGSAGYQASFGVADEVSKLVENAFDSIGTANL